ncbi:WD40/YVTN/BNR-like repeat-containing protein [Portibacter marinus]|uniref:WD40/YVTN/BNR-like repeat-containing protein n=1 Tax=Portibacter marinus TaxID=2898660 RepID=UPI001F2A9CE1|nr:glycoside hydrolase [Portibacter marinus]
MRKILILEILVLSIIGVVGQDNLLFQDLEYRLIGPFRGGRTVGAVGIPDQPGTFFIGVNNGGVWKTDDFGRTWNPIFDDAPTGSVGDLAVSLSDPDVIYVGTGEGLHRPDLSVGDGMFKSIDGGKNWSHIGLDDVQQISRVIIHPSNSDVVYVAGMGHPYGANEMRGVFKTTDGGENWQKVLYINDQTTAMQVEFDPKNPDILYASMWEHQEGPWENAKFSGPSSGLYKSEDSGKTWRKIGHGLPGAEEKLGRIGIGISPSNPDRIYATVGAEENGGLYRSEDAGENWKLVSEDYRVYGRPSDFAELKVHPNDPDIVFSGNIASYKSIDGGKTWMSIKGAPGGDDYHRIWINPLQPDIMLFAADQGATITVNGGKTWSSWYNQPTSQLYHVSTDNQFPYWVYGGQQESGAIGIASRRNGGQISFRDFQGVGADEYGYVAPDPKDPDIIYGGRVIKFNKKTGQSQNVAPEILRSEDTRFLRSMPLYFHPSDQDQLLFGTNKLWSTRNGGMSWETISPDLTRKKPEVPKSVGEYNGPEYENMPQRAIIYALGPSPLNKNIIWAGTDDGLVHYTKDGGKNWVDVTPDAISSWDKISNIEAGHFDEKTAFIAVNAIRKDNMKPLIFKTHDMGKTWSLITNGMHPIGPVNVVREDPKQAGLLYAGTEREVYFSSDDGGKWQSLKLNMPASSIRDLVVHQNDLVIGTHGRSIWILDDVNPLRNLLTATLAQKPLLLKPSMATRVRDNMFSDTPLPPEEPTGTNPPDGAIIDYILPENVREVNIQILDQDDQIVYDFNQNIQSDRYDSTDLPHPLYWIKESNPLSSKAGHHRAVWNLRHNNPTFAQRTFSISAVKDRTSSGPKGPFVHPGIYKVKLMVDDRSEEKTVEVRMDPRVNISEDDLQLQSDLSLKTYKLYEELSNWRNKLDNLPEGSKNADQADRIVGPGLPRDGDILYGSILETDLETETITSLQTKLLFVLQVLQSADARPTEATVEAVNRLEERYKALNSTLNQMIRN